MVICLERGADLHMAQLMPLPLTVSCFSKIQIGFTILVPAHPGSLGKRAVKRVSVCTAEAIHCSANVAKHRGDAARRYHCCELLALFVRCGDVFSLWRHRDSHWRSAGRAGRTGRHLLEAANGRKLFVKIHVKIQIVISYVCACNKNKTLYLHCTAN